MAENKLNLEELAEVAEEETETKGNEPSQNSNSKKENKFEEMQKMFKLPFEVAMQNLKVDKSLVLKLGEQLLTKGYVQEKIEFPVDNYMILTSKKASDELDYYTFVVQAIEKNLTEDEFEYLLGVRNLASMLLELKFGEYHENFKGKNIEYKYSKLLELPSISLRIIMMQSAKFQSAMLLLMHPKAIDFLTNSLQR